MDIGSLHDSDGYVEGLCQRFYTDDGRPGLSPGRYFLLLLMAISRAWTLFTIDR